MPQANSPDPDLTAIESALGALAPTPSRLDRDQLMFQAGRRSEQSQFRRRWAWPSLAATLAAVALGEAAALAVRPVRQIVVVQVPVPAAPPQAIAQQAAAPKSDDDRPPAFDADFELLRPRVGRVALDEFPEPVPVALDPGASSAVSRPIPSGILLRSEIAKLLNPGEPS